MAATNRKGIQAALKARIAKVDNDVPVVVGPRRLVSFDDLLNWGTVRVRGSDSSIRKIKVWEVTRSAATDIKAGGTGVPITHVRRQHVFTIRGLLSYDEERDSFEELQVWVDQVMDDLTTNPKLDNVSQALRILSPSVRLSTQELTSAFLHVAELELTIEEQYALS